MDNNEYDFLKIRAIKSYNGITFSFDSDDYYDLYYLYMKCGDNFEFILSSKSLLLNDEKLIEGNTYYVDGYKIINGEYVLKGKSNVFKCEILNRVKDFDKPLISIVCPMYNSDTCIANCIDSILLSTQGNIEIIIVDDGSTDNCKTVVSWYVDKYPGIVSYYYQEHHGVSFARNKGIFESNGQYMGFIDSDDYVHPRMYQELLMALNKEKTSIAIGKTICIDPKENISVILNVPNVTNERSCSVSYEDVIDYKNKRNPKNVYFVSACHILVDSDIVKNHLFPNFNHYEDIAFTRMLYSYFDNFAFAHNAYYVWDQRIRNTLGSESTRNYNNKTSDIYEIHKKYFRSIIYGYLEGNKKRKDLLLYDVVVELYDYLKGNKYLNKDNDLYKIVANEINKYFTSDILLGNKYILSDNEIIEYIINL